MDFAFIVPVGKTSVVSYWLSIKLPAHASKWQRDAFMRGCVFNAVECSIVIKGKGS